MAKQATQPAGPNKGRALTTRADLRGTSGNRERLRAGLLERVLVMRAACEVAGLSFDEWYCDGAEVSTARVLVGAVAEVWQQLRTFAEAADLTVAELLWSVGLDFDENPSAWDTTRDR